MNYKFIFYLFLIICVFYKSTNATNSETFLKANNAFNKKEFLEAINLYNVIQPKGISEWFNIGNCYFKLEKYAHAIAAWKKALHFANFQEISNIEYNIEQAFKKLNIETNISLKTIFNICKKFLTLIPLIYLQIFFLTFWYLFFVLIFRKRKLNNFMTFILSFNLIIFSCIIIKQNENKQTGVVVENETTVFAGPDNNQFHKIGTLDLACEVNIEETVNKWIKISKKNLIGWVLSDSLFIV